MVAAHVLAARTTRGIFSVAIATAALHPAVVRAVVHHARPAARPLAAAGRPQHDRDTRAHAAVVRRPEGRARLLALEPRRPRHRGATDADPRDTSRGRNR